jgi:carboxylesterase
MARHPWVDPSPFAFIGGPVGILLIHGFTGAPPEMRLLGEFLAAQGYTVLGPLLPGHGTEPADLNRVQWRDWTLAVEAAYVDLASRTEQVVVGGLSMGGLLALHLGAAAPQDKLRGLMLFAPGLRVMDWRLPLSTIARHIRPILPRDPAAPSDLADPEAEQRLWHYDAYPVGGASQLWYLQRAVRRQLKRVTAPILLLQGRRDSAVRTDSPQAVLDHVGSTDKELIWLENSGHVLLVDIERDFVFAKCLAWIQAHTNTHLGGSSNT